MKKAAILAEDMYEDMELNYPYYRLKEAGFTVDIAGTASNMVYKGKHGYPVKSNVSTGEIKPEDYDAVIIPGGYAPDRMRRYKSTLYFVREMDRRKNIIASICHGGWMLASACDIKGKKLTSFFAIKDDLVHAGAEFIDEKVVVDGHIITSRTPDDLPMFMKEIIDKLETG